MPLPMVHLAVAVRVKDKLKIEDDGAFYLGSIAPDAIHMREGASTEDKFRSHMGMRGNLFENERNAKALIGRSDFLTGYAVHLVTDMYWSREVGTAFKARFRARFPDADHAPAYYNDTDLADLALYRSEPWVPEVYAALESARGEAADDLLSAEEVEKWRLRQLHWFEQDFAHLKPAEYITREEINRYIEFAAEKCLEYFGVK